MSFSFDNARVLLYLGMIILIRNFNRWAFLNLDQRRREFKAKPDYAGTDIRSSNTEIKLHMSCQPSAARYGNIPLFHSITLDQFDPSPSEKYILDGPNPFNTASLFIAVRLQHTFPKAWVE